MFDLDIVKDSELICFWYDIKAGSSGCYKVVETDFIASLAAYKIALFSFDAAMGGRKLILFAAVNFKSSFEAENG